jgi:K+-transporting ATPase KdpF subunit
LHSARIADIPHEPLHGSYTRPAGIDAVFARALLSSVRQDAGRSPTGVEENHHGRAVSGLAARIFRPVRRVDPVLCPSLQRRAAMNWIYWISAIAALGIFVYLVVALFKPELFS